MIFWFFGGKIIYFAKKKKKTKNRSFKMKISAVTWGRKIFNRHHKRKEKFLGHTSTFNKMQRIVLLRNIAKDWSTDYREI